MARDKMDVAIFFRGLLVGFAIAAPVGPIGLLCIQRTLAQRRLTGLVTGMGAASADAVFGLIAGLGVAAANSGQGFGVDAAALVWVNRVAGAVLVVFGLYFLVGLVE